MVIYTFAPPCTCLRKILKKIRTCNLNITNAMFSAFSFALLSPPLLLRYSSASKPLQVRSLEWEVNGNHMGLTWEEEGRKKGFPEELIAFGVYALPSILAIFILSF